MKQINGEKSEKNETTEKGKCVQKEGVFRLLLRSFDLRFYTVRSQHFISSICEFLSFFLTSTLVLKMHYSLYLDIIGNIFGNTHLKTSELQLVLVIFFSPRCTLAQWLRAWSLRSQTSRFEYTLLSFTLSLLLRLSTSVPTGPYNGDNNCIYFLGLL